MLPPTLLDPEWDEYADAWFHRSVTRFAQKCLLRVHGWRNAGWADDPEFIAAIADALLARRAEFVRWTDHEKFVPDGCNGYWEIDWQAIDQYFGSIAVPCRERIELDRESRRFPTLDAWLAALGRGEVGKGPLHEPYAGHLDSNWTPDARPRFCRVCGGKFRGGRLNAARCPDCRGGTQRRTARKEGRR